MSGKRRFLERFEPRQRANVANRFLGVVRDGGKVDKSEPTAIVAGVCSELRRQMISARRYGNERIIERNRDDLERLSAHPDEALDYALWAVEWEAKPEAEKEQIKRERGEIYRKQAMEAQPPTEKQIKYLRSLGWTGEIESKLDASEKIDKLLKEGKTQWVCS